jgi:hypothetical protein
MLLSYVYSTLHILAVMHIAKPIPHLKRYLYPWIFNKIHGWIYKWICTLYDITATYTPPNMTYP